MRVIPNARFFFHSLQMAKIAINVRKKAGLNVFSVVWCGHCTMWIGRFKKRIKMKTTDFFPLIEITNASADLHLYSQFRFTLNAHTVCSRLLCRCPFLFCLSFAEAPGEWSALQSFPCKRRVH